MMISYSSRHSQAGVGLIEVLIAVLVLAVGLLGMAALQAVTLKNVGGAMERTQATVRTYAILDSMRANIPGVAGGNYNLAISRAGDGTCNVPTGGALAEQDLASWISTMKADMNPTACGSVSCAGRVCTVTIEWNDQKQTGGSTPQQIVTKAEL